MLTKVLVPLALALVASAASAPGPARAADPLQYVALGDSYSAGSGNVPMSPGFPPECMQSTKNYPHVIAARLGAHLTDVTCGGAATRSIFNGQYPGVPAQLDAVTADTDLVTITIGGNDQGLLIRAAGACGAAGIVTLGRGAPCATLYKDSFDKTIATIAPRLHEVFAAIRAKAPHARIAVLGYPDVLPPTGGCFRAMPIATGDVPYLYGIESHLNEASRQAAIAEGATFVDFSQASLGHDSCQPVGTRWIDPIFFPTGDAAFVHPNALGEQAMADRTLAVLGLG